MMSYIEAEHTKQWRVNPEYIQASRCAIQEASALLQAGRTVAFPTETVYGLGADARSDDAVARIYSAKGRPSDNPLIVHIGRREQLAELAESVSPVAERLIARFWPGPLTIVFPAKPGVLSPKVTAGLDTVAVRMPDHPVALALIAASGCPIAAPSANRSGRPSPTRASHVLEDLAGRIAGVVDGGASGVGLESTVVEVRGDAVTVLRPGGISVEQLREVAPDVALDPALAPAASDDAGFQPRSPGMKYAHYAPRGRMLVVSGDAAPVRARMLHELAVAREQGQRTGVLTFDEHAPDYGDAAELVSTYGRASDYAEAAKRLYDALRAFDEAGIEFIVAEALREEGIGHAVMNRLVKAASGHIVSV